MIAPELQEFARRAQELFDQRLKSSLEKSHWGYFVAIEPESGDYFLGTIMQEATAAARKAPPDRMSHLVRVGHSAAVHIGMLLR